MDDGTWILGDYVIGSRLSDEFTTEIFEACNRNTGEVLVIKYPKPNCTQTARELSVLSQISHPGIIELRDVIQTPNGPGVVLPLARSGDLFGWIETGGFPERHVKCIVFRILSALSYLHA
jgi:serine/threonine protein kinase